MSETRRVRWPTVLWRVAACTLALALLLKWSVVDGYEVRGNSMHPLLVDRVDGPDRVIVIKPWYRWFEPERFDLVVFERPESEAGAGAGDAHASPSEEPPGDRFVKRVIGMSGETIRIEGGDAFIDGAAAPLRKPIEKLLEMLEPVTTLDANASESADWQAPAGAKKDGAFVLDANAAGGAAELRYLQTIRDSWVDERGALRPGGDAVNDVAMFVRLETSGGEARVEFELRDAGDTFVLEWTSAGVARLHRRVPAESIVAEVTRTDLAPAPGRVLDVMFSNVDNEVLFRVAGETVLEYRYDKNTPVEGVPISAEPALRAAQGIVVATRVELRRDVAYPDVAGVAPGTPTKIPDGCYFLLGDNGANSRDSRYFGPIPRDRFRGRPWCIVSPWRRFRWL